MTRYISSTDTAKLIRAALKKRFPRVKFSVKTSKYAGGSSIRIRYEDGPARSMVEAVTNAFAGSGFDGMIDMKYSYDAFLDANGFAYFAETSGTEGSMGVVPADKAFKPSADAERVRFGVDFVFVERDYSRAFLERAQAAAMRKFGFAFAIETNSYDGSAYADTYKGFGVDDEWKQRELTAFIQRRAVA